MAKTMNGTAVDQGWNVNNISVDWGKNACYAGHTTDASNAMFYVYCLQFATPKFSGKSVKIAFDLSMKMLSAQNPTLRFALCKSTDNCKDYYFTFGEVADDAQIASVSQVFTLTESYARYTVEMETEELKPNTAYYLYIWAGSEYSLSYVNAKENHTITLTYKANGGVRITTSVAQNKIHAAVIYVNGAWKRYVPVVYTSSGWKRQG